MPGRGTDISKGMRRMKVVKVVGGTEAVPAKADIPNEAGRNMGPRTGSRVDVGRWDHRHFWSHSMRTETA